jgi:hypothetical protein
LNDKTYEELEKEGWYPVDRDPVKIYNDRTADVIISQQLSPHPDCIWVKLHENDEVCMVEKRNTVPLIHM